MSRSAAVSAAALAALVVVAPAAAQDPAPVPAPAPPPAASAPPAQAPAPEPLPEPQAAPPTLSLRLENVTGRSAAVVAGTRFRVRGVVSPYVHAQQVVVRFYHGDRKVASRRVTVRPLAGGARGGFVVGYAPTSPGHVVVRANHRATAEQGTMVAKGAGVDVLPLHVTAGARGAAVRVLQRRLAALGYVVGRRGVFDDRTARAIVAFRKVTGMARTAEASSEVLRRLARGQGRFKLRYPRHGRHVEADLSRQVVVLANGSKVERIYPTSSGSPATPTVLGSFRVYRKDPGTNAKGMVFSTYFIGGYAIHGYVSVPVFNASHGCLRVPVPDAIPIFNWVKMGDRVDVYP
jgi:hypothetical protein